MRVAVLFMVLGLMGHQVPRAWAQGSAEDYARWAQSGQRPRGAILNARIEPHWSTDGDKLWYSRDLGNGKKEFVLVDARTGTREVVTEDKLPEKREVAPMPRQLRRGGGGGGGFRFDGSSPDGRWTAFIKDDNVWIRERATREEKPLSKGGTSSNAYGPPFYWSPDSKKLVVMKRTPGGDRRVTLVESSPRDQLQPRVITMGYLKPGDEIPQAKPHLFDLGTTKEIPVSDKRFDNPWDITRMHWEPDSRRFLFVYNQRGHQVLRVLALDADSGSVANIINEECKTFFDYTNKLFFQPIDATKEIIWMSERSGWNHLYLIDSSTGQVKNAITTGDWLVRGVDWVDEEKREIGFRAMGIHPDQDPYHVHFARVKFDGTGLTILTSGDGNHTISYSPDRRYLLASYSRVDLPPVTELRNAVDGKKICELEKANDSGLRKTGWKPPQRFVAKGRDGKTDIHGVIFRPSNFDPAKKYPVVEQVYAGPQGFFVPKTFGPGSRMQAMAELGFIVVQSDGMGTNWRSKAFHDVCWKNLGDGGFPDRIQWIKTAVAKFPEMDISKGVGIYGGSAGGQNSLRGMTEYPDFYSVCVSDCGCHDNRMDKVWWNEQWMGWPIGPHYAAQSNVTNAHKLKGKLLLVVGELDRNVDPSSTMQVANALIKADKDFELLLVPGAGHGAAETPYGNRKRADFFVRHLLGVEPRHK